MLVQRLHILSLFPAVLIASVLDLSVANAAGMNCNGACSWSVAVDDREIGSGWYSVDGNGDIVLNAPWSMDLGNGSSVRVDTMSGNIDPIVGFGLGATTGAAGKTFTFNFSLPIALSGSISANSSVSYSLTSLSDAGAQITPLFGHVVTAQEVDTSVGGLAPLNKGVDVGDTFSVLGGPTSASSPVYTAVNMFVGDIAYDLMSVTVAFALSSNSTVGVSGFVQQLPTPVPLPAALPLLLSGLAALGFGAVKHGKHTG